jgi:hypothetical protein
MATAAQMKSAILNVTGKDLGAEILIESARLYCASWGGQWVNPHEEGAPEHDAWPTLNELGDFMAQKTRSHWQSRIWRQKKKEAAEANQASENAAAQVSADKL